MSLSLREARPDDIHKLYEWRCRDDVAKQMIGPKPFSFDAHEAWFQHRLADDRKPIYIIKNGDNPVGAVTVEIRQNIADMGIYIGEPGERSKGLATEALKQGMKLVKDQYPIEAFYAIILKKNDTSQRLFSKCGYERVSCVDSFKKYYEYFRKIDE